MKNIFSYIAIGLSVLALVLVLVNSGSFFGAVPSANCNGRSYCTAFTDLLSTNVSSTGNLNVTGNTTIGGSLASGAMTVSSTLTVSQGASSTLKLGGTGGCLEIAMPGTTTLVYYQATSTSNAILGTTTKPAACQ